MPEFKNKNEREQALIDQMLHHYIEEVSGSLVSGYMPPHEASVLLHKRPDLVAAYADSIYLGGERHNKTIKLVDFLDFLKDAPDYLESLLPVFKTAPDVFPIYAAYAQGLHTLPPEKRTDERYYNSRISKTTDAQLVIQHLQKTQSLVQKIRAAAPENDDLSVVTSIFDGSVDVHVRRNNIPNLLGIRIWIGAAKNNTDLQKKLLPLEIRATNTGLIDTREHAGKNKNIGYLFKPESTEVDEEALFAALANYAPNSPELRRALEANTPLENYLTQ